jgi:Rrf2 family protein
LRTISRKTKYGLRAMYHLGRKHGEGNVLIATLAEEEKIPLKFLEAILLELKGAGLLDSRKGKKGGYRLNGSPEQITVGSIVRALEGPLAPLPCASERSFQPCEECVDVDSCGTRMIMREVRDEIARILDGTTLAQIIAREDNARESGKPDSLMFYI